MHSRISGPTKYGRRSIVLHPSHQSITVSPENKHFASAAERVDVSVGTSRSNDTDGNKKVKKTISLIRGWSKSIEGGGPEQRGCGS